MNFRASRLKIYKKTPVEIIDITESDAELFNELEQSAIKELALSETPGAILDLEEERFKINANLGKKSEQIVISEEDIEFLSRIGCHNISLFY